MPAAKRPHGRRFTDEQESSIYEAYHRYQKLSPEERGQVRPSQRPTHKRLGELLGVSAQTIRKAILRESKRRFDALPPGQRDRLYHEPYGTWVRPGRWQALPFPYYPPVDHEEAD